MPVKEDNANLQLAQELARDVVRILDGFQAVPAGKPDPIGPATSLGEIEGIPFHKLWIWKEDVQGKRFLDEINHVVKATGKPKPRLIYPGAFDAKKNPDDVFLVVLDAVGIKGWYAGLSADKKAEVKR